MSQVTGSGRQVCPGNDERALLAESKSIAYADLGVITLHALVGVGN